MVAGLHQVRVLPRPWQQYGTCKTVTAILWPWLESVLGFQTNVLKPIQVVPFSLRSETAVELDSSTSSLDSGTVDSG